VAFAGATPDTGAPMIFGTNRAPGEPPGTARPLVIAHRGASREHPENMLAALDAAISTGADAIEIDVRLTADGAPVLLHDATVDRTTGGSGPIAAMTLADVRHLSTEAGCVPTLGEALAAVAGRVPLLVELKVAAARAPVLACIEAAGGPPAALMSFLPNALAPRDPDDGVPRIPLTDTAAGLWRLLARPRPGLSALGAWHRLVDRRLVEHADRQGLGVLAWTADRPDEWRRLTTSGVAGIITNDPRGLGRHLRESVAQRREATWEAGP